MARVMVLLLLCLVMYLLIQISNAGSLDLAESLSLMVLLSNVFEPPLSAPFDSTSTLAFGFLILSAYLLASLLSRLWLPRITGYIIAGMLFGPSLLGFVGGDIVGELRLIDDLALTFIAFAAGAELRLEMLRERMRSIVMTLICLMGVAFVGVAGSLFLLRASFPFTAGRSTTEALVIVALCGALAVARSPSSAIAIISETKARGPFTETVLGVTVAADVLTIFVFAVVLSLGTVALTPGQSLNLLFLVGLAGQVVASVVLGLLLGKAMALYLEHIHSELTIFILGVAFVVTKLTHAFAYLLETGLDLRFHLEPMLICMTAGFFIQNYSPAGESFVRQIDRSSLPIYAIFFALSGAALQLESLRYTWHWALVLVALRALFIYGGTYLGGTLCAAPGRVRQVSGLAFLTQAGVSLGLVKLIIERFPSFGPSLASLLVASIALNQIFGPAGFKFSLAATGETRTARLQRASSTRS